MPSETHEEDATLLRDYCHGRSEEAFRLLVERHLPTVWSAARRLVNGDAAMAEDISQEVFSHLAQRASSLPPRVVLGGWLYRHTCFTAAKSVRRAVRRRARELTAASAMTAPVSDPWSGVAPHLDAALQSLSAADRNAVVLRFFEKQDFRSIGIALGTTEDAARMKTARAVEKLRSLLGRRGAVLTAAVLASLLGERAVAAPPAGMAATVATSSLTNAGRVATGTLAALWTALMRRKAAIAGGLVLLMTGSALWYWKTLPGGAGKSRIAARTHIAGNAGQQLVSGPKKASVTVYFIVVPESTAAALLNDRWNSDGDQALFDSLLKQAGTRTDRIVLAQTLSGECVSRRKIELKKTREISIPRDSKIRENGMIIPDRFEKRDLGSTAQVDLTVHDDSPSCDLSLDIRHHFADPLMNRCSTSLENPESPELPAAENMEFRSVSISTRVMLESGHLCLAASTQLPPLPELPAGTPPRRLLTFVTTSILPPS